jgi:hypothetical protein
MKRILKNVAGFLGLYAVMTVALPFSIIALTAIFAPVYLEVGLIRGVVHGRGYYVGHWNAVFFAVTIPVWIGTLVYRYTKEEREGREAKGKLKALDRAVEKAGFASDWWETDSGEYEAELSERGKSPYRLAT